MKTLLAIFTNLFFATICILSLNQTTYAQSYINYAVDIETGNFRTAGTSANVYLTIIGSRGRTRAVRLNSYVTGDAFEAGDKDRVVFGAKDVGTLKGIKIWQDGTYAGSEWYVVGVRVKNLSNLNAAQHYSSIREFIKDRKSYTFPRGSTTTSNQRIDATIKVKTSNIRKAGTDANVYLTIIGEKRTMSNIRLNQYISGNAFESGDTDYIKLRNVIDFGKIKQIIVSHDNKYSGAGWHLNSINISTPSTSKSFSCNCWIEGNSNAKTLR